MKFSDLKTMPTSVMSDITDSEMFAEIRAAKPVPENNAANPVDSENPPKFESPYVRADENVSREYTHSAARGVPPQFSENTENPENTDVNFGELLNGEMITDLWDTVAPVLMVYAAKILLKTTCDKRSFGLLKKEKDLLSPIVQKCMEHSQMKFDNPWSALTFAIIFIYGSKFADIAANKTEKPEKSAGRGRPKKTV